MQAGLLKQVVATGIYIYLMYKKERLK